MAFLRISSLVVRNIIARGHQGLAPRRVERRLFYSHGAAPVRVSKKNSLGASELEYYVSSSLFYEFTITNRGE